MTRFGEPANYFFSLVSSVIFSKERRRPHLWHPCRCVESNRRVFGFNRASPPNPAEDRSRLWSREKPRRFRPEMPSIAQPRTLAALIDLSPNRQNSESVGTLVNTASPPLPSLRRRIFYNSPLPVFREYRLFVALGLGITQTLNYSARSVTTTPPRRLLHLTTDARAHPVSSSE